jgi:hypothetical protein
MNRPYLHHLTSSHDLETTYEATRAGFVALALEKNRQASPYLEEARALKIAAAAAPTPAALLDMSDIQRALLTAAGVSGKANSYLTPEDRVEAIKGLIKNFLEPAGALFVEELIFRFLLIRGDALGGSMRNIGGVLALRKLTRALIAALRVAGKSYRWLHAQSSQWMPMADEDVGIETWIKGLHWQNNEQSRVLLYSTKIPLTNDFNVDLCLVDAGQDRLVTPKSIRARLDSPTAYLALGELKGGIDPAGADEHWKTARTALNRIRESFVEDEHHPHLFFIGAAIESKMAVEIWSQLTNGLLTNAANLNDSDQLASISRWLCGL